jgi:hypothetical protein
MTVNNPPSYLQNDGPNAEQHRQHMTAAFGEHEGVIKGLAVTEKSGTPNMSVDVSEGRVLVAGTEGTYQGLYMCHNRGVENLAISASDPTNDRYDLIVATVEDADYSGATDAWKLDVVSGTPAATPLFPAIDDNTFVLATVLVQNGVSSIVDADITDIRSGSDTDGTTALTNYGFAALQGVIRCTSSTRPQSPEEGWSIYETDTDREYVYDGSGWRQTSGPGGGNYAVVSRDGSDFAIPNNSYTPVEFNTDKVMPSGWSSSSGVITVPEDGLYFVKGQVRWDGNATGIRILGLFIEGSLAVDGVRHNDLRDSPGTGDFTQASQTVTYLAAGDTVAVSVYQSSGGSLNVQEVQDYSHLLVARVG